MFACRSNPFGGTNNSIEEFTVYTTDFTAQNDGGAKTALLDVIGGAKATLHCAFSALTLTDVTNALIGKATTGVQVKVAFDADVKTSDAGSVALQASSAFVVVTAPVDTKQSQLLYGNGGTAYMRHNFCLADERYIYISTAGADDTQMRKTPNVALKIGSPQFGIARDFLRESNMFSQLLFGNGKAKTDFTTKFTALNQVIGAYWGPQESPLDILGTNLSEATARVDFYSTAFQTTNSSKSDLDVPQVLLRLESAKGIPLKKYFSSQALFDLSSKAYTLSNPSMYLNNSVSIGPNIFVVDRGLSSAKTFIYTGSLRSQANSSDDGVLLELRGKYASEIVGAYLDKIGTTSTIVSNTGDTGANLDVAISEINWMGSYSNGLAADPGDEFVEFYNNKSVAVNVSGWKFACTTNGTTANTSITLPAGALIAPGGYFVVANKSTGAFASANHFDTKVNTTNSSIQCQLGDGKTAAAVYGVANFGNTIDTAGAATAFDTVANMGTNDSTNKIRRSMERVDTTTSGANTTNWQANVYSSSQNTGVAASFRDQTFASIGAGLSTVLVAPGTFKITEISIDGSGDSVELRCIAGGSIAGFKLNLSNGLRYTFPSATFVAGDIIVFHAQAAGTDETGGNPTASGDAGATAGYDFWQLGSAITSTNAELEITTSGSVSQDYVAWTTGVFGSGQATRVDAHIASSHWTKATGTLVESDLVDSTLDDGGLCLQRINTGAGTTHTDANSRSDWTAGTCGLGTNQDTSPPVFNVSSAAAIVDSTHVTVTFSRAPNLAQAATSTNYSISGGLTVSAASLSGNTVTLTTSAQGSGTAYTVTVTGVTGVVGGTALTTNSAGFTGFASLAVMVINEVNSNITSCDLIELRVTQTGSINGMILKYNGTALPLIGGTGFPNLILNKNDYIVIHLNYTNTTCFNTGTVPATNETTINQYLQATYLGTTASNHTYDAAYDFFSTNAGMTHGVGTLQLETSTGTIIDFVPLANLTTGTTGYAAARATEAQNAVSGGHWNITVGPADWTCSSGTNCAITGAWVDNGANGAAMGTTTSNSMCRNSNIENNIKGDWSTCTGTASWGANNPGQTNLP
jgi:Lamin Tail Domain